MVEVVIMLGIIVIVSAVVLANFPGVSASINLQRSVQQLALWFRQAQNQALAVRQVQGPFGPVVPPGVGVYISTADPTHYIIFADICPSDEDYCRSQFWQLCFHVKGFLIPTTNPEIFPK